MRSAAASGSSSRAFCRWLSARSATRTPWRPALRYASQHLPWVVGSGARLGLNRLCGETANPSDLARQGSAWNERAALRRCLCRARAAVGGDGQISACRPSRSHPRSRQRRTRASCLWARHAVGVGHPGVDDDARGTRFNVDVSSSVLLLVRGAKHMVASKARPDVGRRDARREQQSATASTAVSRAIELG
jgi:hypothetical protein